MTIESRLKQLDEVIHAVAVSLGKEAFLYLIEARLFSESCRYEWFQNKYKSKERTKIQHFLDETQILLNNPNLDPKEVMRHALLCDFLIRHWYNKWHIDSCDPKKLSKIVKIHSEEQFHRAHKQGKGVILVQYHSFAARLVFPWLIGAGVHPMHSVELSPVDKLEQHKPGGIVESVKWARTLLKAKLCLEKGGVIRILPDGFQGRGRTIVEFCQRIRQVQSSFAELSLETGAIILPTSAVTNFDGTVKIRFHEPLDRGKLDQSKDDRIQYLLSQYLSFLNREWSTAPGNISSFYMQRFLDLTNPTNRNK